MEKTHYRVAIIGSGPAGWTAALYAARAELAPIVVKGSQPGGQLSITTEVENYPGFPHGKDGPEMMDLFEAQARRFGTQAVLDMVTDVDLSARPFRLSLESGTIMTADAVIVATGASARKLGPELDKVTGQYLPGTSACATCDGPLPAYRGKELAVVGGGDTAMEEATFLTKYASRVTLIHRREEFRASKIMLERARANPKIAWKVNSTVEGIQSGPLGVESLELRNTQTGDRSRLAAGGLFVAIGHEPNTAIFRGKLAMNEAGYLKIEHPSTRTSVEGVFAAGDVADPTYRQAISAAGEGCKAAMDAERWLAAKGIH
ncbi:MAG: thioredoxin-disulfide reductase [Thermoanaerobaculia bacterium]|nr:thioredoxin-disulfide reductase [Thermoanaerobaculia bacterium]